MLLRFLSILLAVGLLRDLYALPTNILSVGSETYFMERSREGGTYQTGVIEGIHCGYDRIGFNQWYIGGNFLYARGNLDGVTGRGRLIDSSLTDRIAEGRLGFTLRQHRPGTPFFTPFGGLGHFCETNHFFHLYTFEDTFFFFTAGFLAGIDLTPRWQLGLNFKGRFMINGKSKITDEDPEFGTVILEMSNTNQFRIEIPLSYTFIGAKFFHAYWIVMPFYEYRHFGGKEGFPFDFIDTQFHLIGTRIAIALKF